MKKLILPILFGVFTLFFSGKSLSHKNCGPTITISNFPGKDASHITLPVTQVVVHNYTTGHTTVYDNPTFPFNHGGSGGWLKVSFVFDGAPYNACVYLEDSNTECLQSQGTSGAQYSSEITFPAFTCGHFYIAQYHLLPGETCVCPY
jgi:hypothetical protein